VSHLVLKGANYHARNYINNTDVIQKDCEQKITNDLFSK